MRLYFEEKTRVLKQMRQDGCLTSQISAPRQQQQQQQQNSGTDGFNLQPIPSTSRNANGATTVAEYVADVLDDI